MKAVLMRRHQTMADVVPITTLLAILIYIGYCSDTAGGTEEPGASSLQEEAVQVPEKNSVTGEKQQQEGTDGGLKVPVAQLSSDGGTLNPSGGTAPLEGAAELLAPSSQRDVQLSGQGDELSASPGQSLDEALEALEAPRVLSEKPEASEQGALPGVDGTGSLPGEKRGERPESTPSVEATADRTGADVTVKGPQSSGAHTTVTDVTNSNPVQPSAQGPTLLDGHVPETLDKDISEGREVLGAVGSGLPVLKPNEASVLVSKLPAAGGHGSQLTSLVGQATGLGVGQGGLLPNAQLTPKPLQADGSTSAEGGPTETSTQRQQGDPGIVSTTETGYTAPDPQTPLPGGGVTGLQNTLAAPITEDKSTTAETVIQPPTQNKVTSPTSITTQETTAPTPPTLTAPQQHGITPVSQYTPPEPSTSTQAKEGVTTETDAGTTADSETSTPVTVKVNAPGDITGSLPGTTTEAATLYATTPRAGDAQTPGTAITATGHTGNTEAMPAVKGETPLTSKAGHTPRPATGATTLTDVTVKGPQSSGAHTTVTEHTPPVDTAGTLSGTTDSRTTRQGPSPPAGASQASADVTVQQGPTPEEKKEQQKEVTGITPQGSPRQEGQQQKGQTPQGPPPLGSTSGATPGKDNTRETAKTPPTGTDTNNNNNNITIPKIAVNETIISATVVPSAIPAVLVCSVVFLYLSRR